MTHFCPIIIGLVLYVLVFLLLFHCFISLLILLIVKLLLNQLKNSCALSASFLDKIHLNIHIFLFLTKNDGSMVVNNMYSQIQLIWYPMQVYSIEHIDPIRHSKRFLLLLSPLYNIFADNISASFFNQNHFGCFL